MLIESDAMGMSGPLILYGAPTVYEGTDNVDMRLTVEQGATLTRGSATLLVYVTRKSSNLV